MRQRACTLCVASWILLACACNRADPSIGPPQIHFPETERDLGDLPIILNKGHVVSFAVKNLGASPLRLKQLVSSCGCAQPRATKIVLEPDEEAEVTVRITSEVPEDRRASVDVYSDDPVKSFVRLSFTWRAIAPVEFSPYKLDIGTIQPGEVVERTLDLVRRDDQRWPSCRIDRLECSPSDMVQAEWIKANASGEVTSEKLRVRIVAQQTPGLVTGAVTVQMSECWRPFLTIPLTWEVRDTIEASPSSLMVGTGSSRETRSGTVVVSALAEEILEVERAELINGDETLEAQWEQVAPNRVLIHVEMKLPDQSGLCKSELRVVCSKPIEKTLTIPVSAFVTAGDSGG